MEVLTQSPHVHTLSISTCKNQSTEVCGALYIPTYEYNYKVIIWSDTILKEYYITNRRNARIQGDIQIWTVQKIFMSYKKKIRETSRRPRRIGLKTVSRWSTLPLRIPDQQPKECISSKLWDLNIQVQGSQNSLASGVMNAKWYAGSSTCVSINLNQKHALKTVSWAYTPKYERGIKWWDVQKWQNQLYGLSGRIYKIDTSKE